MSFPKPTKEYPDVCAAPLKELIEAYRASIDILRGECEEQLLAHKRVERADPFFGDDLFLLRFVLSHHKKGIAKAKNFLLKCIEWRAKYADLLEPLRSEIATVAHDEKIRKYLPGGMHFCTNDGHPLFLVRNGIASPHAVARSVTQEQLAEWLLLTKESGHAYCDAKTREMGRIIKVLAVQDFTGVSMMNFNRTFMNALVTASSISETVYPQLLGRSLIVNLPSLLRRPTFLTLKLMPVGLQEKVGICPESDPKKVAEYIAKSYNLHVHDLPTFLGGECTCSPAAGCLNNTPNAMPSRAMTDAEADALKMDSWADYVQYRCGQGRVSYAKGLPYTPEDDGLKARGLLKIVEQTIVDKDGTEHKVYGGMGYCATIHDNFNGNNYSALKNGAVLVKAAVAPPCDGVDVFAGGAEVDEEAICGVSSPLADGTALEEAVDAALDTIAAVAAEGAEEKVSV